MAFILGFETLFAFVVDFFCDVLVQSVSGLVVNF